MQRHHTQSGTARPVHSPAPAYARKYHSENATNALPDRVGLLLPVHDGYGATQNMALSGIRYSTLIARGGIIVITVFCPIR